MQVHHLALALEDLRKLHAGLLPQGARLPAHPR